MQKEHWPRQGQIESYSPSCDRMDTVKPTSAKVSQASESTEKKRSFKLSKHLTEQANDPYVWELPDTVGKTKPVYS